MLPVDLALLHDPEFRNAVEHYAADQDAFFEDFAFAFGKVIVQYVFLSISFLVSVSVFENK
jgi:catalase (peroxidase I)